jgi:peptidoglycan/LPS O-acetylase OafA/YrhL
MRLAKAVARGYKRRIGSPKPDRRPMPFLLSQLIEAARWMGALAVLTLHVNNMFVNQADIMSASHAPPAYLWWFFAGTEMGHQAVVGFFVLSGWLVGGGALARIAAGQSFLREYFVHRVARIYVVLIPTLILTLALDSLGRVFFADSGVYDWPTFQGHFSTALFFAGFLNLQSLVFPHFGTNGPLWSLACEFWYYVAFPLLLSPFARNYAIGPRLCGFALGVALAVALSARGNWFLFGFAIWSIGAFATRAPRPLIRSRRLSLGLLAAAIVIIRLVVRGPLLEAHPSVSLVADLAAAALFANLLLAFRDAPQQGFSALRWKLHAPLADFSFSLYATHMPVVIFARALIGHFLGRDWAMQLATGANYAMAIAIAIAAIASAYGFSRLTEAKTGAARRALRGALDRLIPAATAPERMTAPLPLPVKTGRGPG